MLDFFRPNSSLRYTDLGLLLLRVTVPLLLLPHGYEKLMSFLEGAADFPDPLHVGIRFSHALAVLGEFIAPLLIIVGFFTRWALVVEIVHFLVVAFIMHANEPLGDKEHGLLYLISFIALFLTGAGKYSLDTLLFKKKLY